MIGSLASSDDFMLNRLETGYYTGFEYHQPAEPLQSELLSNWPKCP